MNFAKAVILSVICRPLIWLLADDFRLNKERPLLWLLRRLELWLLLLLLLPIPLLRRKLVPFALVVVLDGAGGIVAAVAFVSFGSAKCTSCKVRDRRVSCGPYRT